MYLAVKKLSGLPDYVIRESYRHGDHFRSRDLLHLGTDPAKYIVYPGGNSFYVEPSIEDHLVRSGIDTSGDELETIFWPFLKPEIKRSLACFRDRELSAKDSRRRFPSELKAQNYHLFDRRRLHFLKFGQANQRRLDRLPARMLHMLFHRSRDEIEQAIHRMEYRLRLRELKLYVYVIFDLQHRFSEHFARENPEFLDPERVDAVFLDAICRLNADTRFWAGMATTPWLHPFLQRYLLMYFDFEYPARSFEDEFVRQFVNGHRRYRPPSRRFNIGRKEAASIFGKTEAELKEMTRQDLVRLFRRRAQRLHPDKGGDHKTFVRLTEAYHRLLSTKNYQRDG
jgi:hypothetical protein